MDGGRSTGAGRWPELAAVVRERGWERREAAFVLSSGGTSHDYVDLRRAVSCGPALELAARAVLECLATGGYGADRFEAIGGMTMGADPVAHAAALLSGRSWFSVRKSEKHHGLGRRIEGATLSDGVPVVLFEDTVSTGGSIFEAYDVVAATGAEIVAACTLLDRGELASERFAALSTPYFALLTYLDLGIDPIVAGAG